MQWALIGLVVAMVLVMILNASRNKKANSEMQNMMQSLKVGDKVKTHIGVYGTIVSITETTDGKVCVIETGDKNKSQIEVDMRVVAGLDDKKIVVYDADNNIISIDGVPVPKKEEIDATAVNSEGKAEIDAGIKADKEAKLSDEQTSASKKSSAKKSSANKSAQTKSAQKTSKKSQSK